MAPDTVSLRYFLVLAEELNFTRAAARIGIAQPALSARIRRLEKELGSALLVRDTRSVALTTAGAALAETAPPALAALDRAWDTARRAGGGEVGTLRVGYSISTGAETVPALVDKLMYSGPGLEVSAVPMATPEISPAVADGRIDAGVTRGEQPGRGVRRYLLRRARIGVQLAQHHPLAEHLEIEIAAATAYPLRLPDRAANPVVHDQLAALFRDVRPQPRFQTPTVSFDMSQRDLRDGLTLAPAGEAAATAPPPGITWRPLHGAPGLTVHLVLPHEQSSLHRRVRAVAKTVANEMNWLSE
ncbi:LysR family transcriptional regulator [Streptomyces alfalfae]|uniref:LysR family transcriptional regulator n=1 Tax=Streptomyces alfalfae TaxID=1642299 RepID=A0ABM6GN03_9ACTN|nr:LysR family transcriptional regulator [Streptomyces alfalfae]AYA15104.1 LysR family transcriptional regulator [Streptomyces fradiae]APY84790.1 LysR family transcriptional regulator [Streptomyces alfalfae]QUI35395.1 LysR family transcriptional regulator [Streptomyces alfalfae]RXX47226.1 LysR family transcriptional regulator [Streptomyces alfalfae]RZM85958.1 LysR family transcriptional regulator [Streptomyces alfalfae]